MRIQRLTKDAKENLLEDLLKRSPNNYGQYEQGVQEILAHVKAERDQAVFEYTKKFDHAEITADNINWWRSSAKPFGISVLIMKNRDSTAGSTANRMERSWDRKLHRFTESVYMCRAVKLYIHLLY